MSPMTSSRPCKNFLYGIKMFLPVQDRYKQETHVLHLGYTIQDKILTDDTKTKNKKKFIICCYSLMFLY